MSIAHMQKVLIASYRSESADVIESLQSQGIMQILDAERAIVSKEWPELHTGIGRPKEVEELSAKINSAVEFLNRYAPKPGFTETLAPRVVVEAKDYVLVARSDDAMRMLDKCVELSEKLGKLGDRREHLANQLHTLLPWQGLEIDIAEMEGFQKGAVILGLIPAKNYISAEEKVKEFNASVEKIGKKDSLISCAIICLKENSAEIYKALRPLEFEAVNLSHFKGVPAELIKDIQAELGKIGEDIKSLEEQVRQLSADRVKLKVLSDHYTNLLERERTILSVPESSQTIILEGWVKKRDLDKLRKILSHFKGTSLSLISPAEDEEVPVHIENSFAARPFEVITRLYGMPLYLEVDPTWFLAPFFAIFFALCLADVGSGLILIAISLYLIKKLQGDKKFMYLLLVCGILTIGTGAMTGGWFGSGLRDLAVSKNITWIVSMIDRTMWFDPLSDPMKFFAIAVALGYFQIMLGLLIGFFDYLRRKEYVAAVCDKLVWFLLVNSLALFGAGKMGAVPAVVGSVAAKFAILPALMILLFSQREGGWPGRIGMGTYQLFSTVFYLGDILSYLRLMALGISSAGVAMAINVIGKTLSEIPHFGIFLAVILLIFGHIFATASSALGAFVHTMRLQFVEYFPKFIVGGGTEFKPLAKQYKYVYVKTEKVNG